MVEPLARITGKTIEQVEKDVSQDLCLTAEEAKEYGLIDAIIG